jgi:hypothetical protein
MFRRRSSSSVTNIQTGSRVESGDRQRSRSAKKIPAAASRLFLWRSKPSADCSQSLVVQKRSSGVPFINGTVSSARKAFAELDASKAEAKQKCIAIDSSAEVPEDLFSDIGGEAEASDCGHHRRSVGERAKSRSANKIKAAASHLFLRKSKSSADCSQSVVVQKGSSGVPFFSVISSIVPSSAKAFVETEAQQKCIAIDSSTTVPEDLFADLILAGAEARDRGQHRRTRPLRMKHFDKQKLVLY